MGGTRHTNEQIMNALAATKGLVYLAAKRLGCKPDTIYARVRGSPEVAACLTAQRGQIVDEAESSLYNAVLKGESWAVQFILKTLGKDRGYVERLDEAALLAELADLRRLVRGLADGYGGAARGRSGRCGAEADRILPIQPDRA